MNYTEIEIPDYGKLPEYTLKKEEIENHNTAYYENGMLVNVSPRNEAISLDEDRQVAYDARYIISDGKKYDLYNTDDIRAIIIPDMVEESNESDDNDGKIRIGGIRFHNVTRELAYHIKMRVKGAFCKELAVPLVYKAVNLMMASLTSYTRNDYKRMIDQLYAAGADDYAHYLDAQLRQVFPLYADKSYLNKANIQRALSLAKQFNSDYLEMPYELCVCGECAKYMGRLYSISGKDKRFPPLPDVILEKGMIHEGCSCSFWAGRYSNGQTIDKYFISDDGEVTYKPVDLLESSNRPFVDDRCVRAVERYERHVEKRRIKEIHEMSFIQRKKWGDRTAEYEWLMKKLPELCPKSLGAYTTAKKRKTKKYLAIQEAARALGRELNDDNIFTDEEKNMKEYCWCLHDSYNKALSAFREAYPETDSDLLKQIDDYSRKCALHLWLQFNTSMDICVSAINEVYQDSIGREEYSKERVEREKRFPSESAMTVPFFFYGIVNYDKKHRTDFSSRLAAMFQVLDITYALIDGKVEKAEANIVVKRQNELLKVCRANGVALYKSDVSIEKYIENTPKPSSEEPHEIISKEAKKIEKYTEKGTVDNELDALIGLKNAKKEIREITNFAKILKARKEKGLPVPSMSYHLVFTGNPGTGKTTVARIIAQIYKEIGIVSEGQLIEASAKDMIAGYTGQTAIKTGDLIKKAVGGVLFIDEAYTLLDKTGQGFGQEAIDTLLKEMEDKRDDLAVIVAGYDELMHEFINSNPGLKSRFNRYVHFDDYTADEMYSIFEGLCTKGGYVINTEAQQYIKDYFTLIREKAEEGFANGRTVRNTFETIISKQASRIVAEQSITEELLTTIEKQDVINAVGMINQPSESIEDVLNEFNSLVGLERAKDEVSELVFIVQNQQRRKAQGLKVPPLSLHLVFMGNPGTGKTTVARCIARIYKCLGLLSKGQLIETDRSGLVAGYVGQTAIKTQEVIQSALGGVLFIDEAYTLSSGGNNDFGQEAIDTLLKAMEDNRDDLVVIVAGYDDQMEQFVCSNPGLQSRFNRYIHFEDYDAEQMCEIFKHLCENNQYILSNDAEETVKRYFSDVTIAQIGNGRGARNVFEKVIIQQAKRIENASCLGQNIDLQEITVEDIRSAVGRG